MIRRSLLKILSPNTGKSRALNVLFDEYSKVVNWYIQVLFNSRTFSGSFVKMKCPDTWLSARMQQCAGKQALEIVKSQRKLKKMTLPVFQGNALNLDSRFVQLSFDNNFFDCWLTLTSLGNKLKLVLPSKKHAHFNKYWMDDWTLKSSIRLRKLPSGMYIEVFFEREELLASSTTDLALDCGYKKLFVDSNGNLYGTELEEMITRLIRTQRGSKGQKRAIVTRNQYIDKIINELPLENVGVVYVEDLNNVKHKSNLHHKVMNKLQWWVYSYALERLKQKCEVVGVQYRLVNPAYTSQTCHRCGVTDKASRQGEMFACTSCSYIGDSDVNAACNILVRGRVQEPIVPVSVK